MNSIDYLKQTKVKLGVESDYALAARLGVTRSSISSLMNGKTQMGDETAMKVADILEIPRGIVLLDIAVERSKNSKNSEVAAAWQGIMEKISVGFEALISRATPRRRRLAAW